MLLKPRIQKAIYIAASQHRTQTRKLNDLPYIVHPFSVAWLLSEQTNDEDVIVAALLHDVVEDTDGYTLKDIARDFGDNVAAIVGEVSEDKKLPWKERKEKYIEGLKSASTGAILVSAADKIHNIFSLHELFLETGKFSWGNEFKSFEESKWFYEAVFEVVKERLEKHPLIDEFKDALALLHKD